MITVTEDIFKRYLACLDRGSSELDLYDGAHRCPICSQNIDNCDHMLPDLEQFFALRKVDTSNTGNPKDSVGANKSPLSPVSRRVIHELGLAMLEGECQYWRHNYRASKVRAMVYIDALERHISAWVEGQDIDPKSGLSHLVKAMACLMIIRDAQLFESLTDDRPPAQADPNWMDGYNDRALAIVRSTEHLVRGAYTESNRGEWPGMSAALNDGPIRRTV
jgi:hypothetical protein